MNTNRKPFKIASLFLAIMLAAGLMPGNIHTARATAAANMSFDRVYYDKDPGSAIVPGQKGVGFTLSSISMDPAGDYTPVSSELLKSIKITANDIYDETYKFDITFADGILSLDLKDPVQYQLRKQVLYNIYIPQGAFKSAAGAAVNAEVNYPFVTNNDDFMSAYNDDILKSVSHDNYSSNVDYKNGEFTFVFIDNIAAADSLSDCIEISSTPIDPDIPGYKYSESPSDSIANYNVSISGNTLVLKAKSGQFKDFANYTVRLKTGAVYLKSSPSNCRVYNGVDTIVNFWTDNVVESIYPADGKTGVELEPVIKIRFKYPINTDTFNLDKVIIASDASYMLNLRGHTEPGYPFLYTFSQDKKELDIIIGKTMTGDDIQPLTLKGSTLYTVFIEIGALELDGYAYSDGSAIHNGRLLLNFTTTGDGESPVVTGYSSSNVETDDITSKDTTRLDANGSIYIHFDRPIRYDQWMDPAPLIDGVSLYKIPQAYLYDYDPAGRLYDMVVSYYPAVYDDVYKIMPANIPDFGEPGDIENADFLEELPVEKVEIIQPNIVKITPCYPLDYLNKYKVEIKREYIESLNGCNPEKDIAFTFWTKASASAVAPVWEGVEDIFQRNVEENAGLPYKSFTVNGAPKYSEDYPIILTLDGEVIVKAADEEIQEGLTRLRRISFDALKKITLEDVYNPDETSNKPGFSGYYLAYFFENGVKKTRLILFTDRLLDYGKQYRLFIPEGVFETRSGGSPGAVELNLVVSGDKGETRGVYALENYKFKAADLKVNEEWTFAIKGFNFIEDIDRVELQPVSGSASETVVIPSGDIFFESVTAVKVRLRGDAAETLSTEGSAGKYLVILYFGDDPDTGYLSPVQLEILPRGKPEVIGKFPYSSDGNVWFNENTLYPRTIDGVTRYFLRVAFRDAGGELAINGTSGLSILRNSCNVYAQGSSSSMIDRDFITEILKLDDVKSRMYVDQYIFTRDTTRKEAYLYIPVKLLRPQTTYSVAIMPEVVYFSGADISESSNDMIMWSFTTMSEPVVRSISVGSVIEDYDEDVPVILTGDFFYSSTVRVFFNDTEAFRVIVKTSADGSRYMEVYLPSGRDRLAPGVYNIIVRNDGTHERIVFGSFSVIKSGGKAPVEGTSIKEENSQGKVVSSTRVSEDTIELKSEYNDNSVVKLDLDELMGEDVLVRKVSIDGNAGNTIGSFETVSKWCNITVYGLALDPYADSKKITLSLGRVEPFLSDTLKSKLRGRVLKSDFIRASGENVRFRKVSLSIPLKNSDGRNVKVMRYDEVSGKWYEEKFTINRTDAAVEVESSKAGIFVVLEQEAEV